MKSTKVQILGTVTLHAATAYTDWAIVQCPALSCMLYIVWSAHVCVCTCFSLVHTCAYVDHYCTSCTDVKWRIYETLQREQNGGLELAWSG